MLLMEHHKDIRHIRHLVIKRMLIHVGASVIGTTGNWINFGLWN